MEDNGVNIESNKIALNTNKVILMLIHQTTLVINHRYRHIAHQTDLTLVMYQQCFIMCNYRASVLNK